MKYIDLSRDRSDRRSNECVLKHYYTLDMIYQSEVPEVARLNLRIIWKRRVLGSEMMSTLVETPYRHNGIVSVLLPIRQSPKLQSYCNYTPSLGCPAHGVHIYRCRRVYTRRKKIGNPQRNNVSVALTVLSSVLTYNKYQQMRLRIMIAKKAAERRTLHDASMLCKVTQTAVTLKTGDHSFPRIEAQICKK